MFRSVYSVDGCNYAHGDAELREVRGKTRDHSGLSGSHSGAGMVTGVKSAPRPDYYTGSSSGFMFTCEPPMVPEIFQKYVASVLLPVSLSFSLSLSVCLVYGCSL